jgi:hypothetical protein
MSSIFDGGVERASVVPRGPTEWGRLIYQEPWAYERRVASKWDPLRVSGAIVLGAIILLMGMTFVLQAEWVLAGMYLFPSLLLLIGSVDWIIKLRHTLPFRVYEKGLTLPGRERAREYQEHDHFVPFDRISSAAVKQDEWSGGPSSFLKFDVMNEAGVEIERVVNLTRGIEVAPIEEALARAAPDLRVERVG